MFPLFDPYAYRQFSRHQIISMNSVADVLVEEFEEIDEDVIRDAILSKYTCEMNPAALAIHARGVINEFKRSSRGRQ